MTDKKWNFESRPWTSKEDQHIRDHYRTRSDAEMGMMLGRSAAAIGRRRVHNGCLRRQPPKRWESVPVLHTQKTSDDQYFAVSNKALNAVREKGGNLYCAVVGTKEQINAALDRGRINGSHIILKAVPMSEKTVTKKIRMVAG